MNMIVGVCLLALLAHRAPGRDLRLGDRDSSAARVVAVTANAWQLLLPVVGAGGAAVDRPVPQARRRRDSGLGRSGLAAAAATLNGLLGLAEPRCRRRRRGRQSPTCSARTGGGGLRSALAWLVLAVAIAGARAWARDGPAMLVGRQRLVAPCSCGRGRPGTSCCYYPVKALWTVMVVVIPLAAAGASLSLVRRWRVRGARQPPSSAVARGVLVLTRRRHRRWRPGAGSAFPPHLLTIAQGRAGMPNWSMALIDSMADVPIAERVAGGAVVFGWFPRPDVQACARGFVGHGGLHGDGVPGAPGDRGRA